MTEEPTTNTVLAVKLDYIQKDVTEVKLDIKEIKKDYVSRSEHVAVAKELEEKTDARFIVNEKKIENIYAIVYWVIGVFGTAAAISLFKLIFI